jgi:predicted DNA binding CopG/RHH family protein
MEAELVVPQFATEAEEADWLYENRERISESFVKAAAEGRLTHGTAKLRALEAQTIVQLDLEDAQRARAAAERKGMQYQAYVKMLVHEALEKEPAA